MKTPSLAVGSDGRNRVLLSPYRSKTGRNQPSTSRFIFGLYRGLRWLIRPPRGYALAYIDWSQQEFGIAARLSGDVNMIAAYESGDCYMAFAIQAGAAPPGATKKTHGAIRDLYKRCVLGVQYQMGERALAASLGVSVAVARSLLEAHRRTYATFWKWSERLFNGATLRRRAVASFGWPLHIGQDMKPRTVTNFPMQANGAEMLRLAVIFMVEAGISVCAPVHDAVLIEAADDQIERVADAARECMARASELVLDGYRLRTDEPQIIRWPDRMTDAKDDEVINAIRRYLDRTHEPACAEEQP